MCMMRRDRRSAAARALGALAAAAVLGGCATKGDIRALQTEIRAELRAQAARQDSLMAILRRESTSTQDTLRTQSDQLVDFRGDISRMLRELTDGQRRLEALVGENQRRLAGLSGAVAGGAATGGSVTGQTLVDGGGTGAAGPETVAGVGGNADQLYGVARDADQRGSLSAAQRAYEEFLRESPNDPRATDARFFLADVLVRQDRPDDAIDMFQQIREIDPTSMRVPEALYRVGQLQMELGQTDAARTTLQLLINTYQDSGMAMLARDLLEELN